MSNQLDKVDYKVNDKEKPSKKLQKRQMAVFVLLIVIIFASFLLIIFLSVQVNDLKQQNEMLIATNEALQQTLQHIRNATPRP